MVNQLWRCNLGNCPYCWVNQIVRTNPELYSVPDRSAHEWTKALNAQDPAVFDFVGGEPFVFPGFVDELVALDEKHRFAITSNLHALPAIEDFARTVPVHKVAHFTGSYHPSGRLDVDEFAYRLNLVKGHGISVSVNIIRHSSIPNADELAADFRERGFQALVSPYEHPPDLETLSDSELTCQAGLTHYVINNNGDVYPCLSWFRYSKRKERLMGNIFDGSFRKYKTRQSCRLRCEMKYVVDQSNSMIQDLEIRSV